MGCLRTICMVIIMFILLGGLALAFLGFFVQKSVFSPEFIGGAFAALVGLWFLGKIPPASVHPGNS